MKNNKRITPKERNLLKGAVRRVFSRSELRRQVVEECLMPDYTDSTRPRVKKWGKCAVCGQPTPKSYLVVDHRLPVVPLDSSFDEMTMDELVNNMWCDKNNLQAIDEECHNKKSAEESKLRRQYKKEKKNGKSKKR